MIHLVSKIIRLLFSVSGTAAGRGVGVAVDEGNGVGVISATSFSIGGAVDIGVCTGAGGSLKTAAVCGAAFVHSETANARHISAERYVQSAQRLLYFTAFLILCFVMLPEKPAVQRYTMFLAGAEALRSNKPAYSFLRALPIFSKTASSQQSSVSSENSLNKSI